MNIDFKKAILLIAVFAVSCNTIEDSLDVNETPDQEGQTDSDKISYMEIYDRVGDCSFFSYPQTTTLPQKHWVCSDVENVPERNMLGQKEPTKGLQYHLLAQSLAGLVNRAMDEGVVDYGLWLQCRGDAYEAPKANLGVELGRKNAIELATEEFKSLIDGYVLTDIENNPESDVVATVAAHVHNSIIVDVRDKAIFDEAGFVMKYDARKKTTADSWKEFKDKCSNKALVLMPVRYGQLREYAIKNRLFLINLHRTPEEQNTNTELFDEVLKWLEPNAPVLGWEKGSENVFVDRISRYAATMLAADISYNHSLTSAGAINRQEQFLAAVTNPATINYDEKANYVSFFMSDGDNYQFVMNDLFVEDYFCTPSSALATMSFEVCSQSLCQLSPDRFKEIYQMQNPKSTMMECFGGGYFYIDAYSVDKGNRAKNLKVLAERTAKHMRQHRLKVLHLMAWDWESDAAKEAYRAFIEANDQLEGIVTVEYDPYSGGRGRLLWFENKKGYDIPVVSTKYALWQDNNNATNGTGDPDAVAGYLKDNDCKSEQSFAAIVVHAWSEFSGFKASECALDCIYKSPESIKVVNIQELIWRIRMEYRPEQTNRYLSTIK